MCSTKDFVDDLDDLDYHSCEYFLRENFENTIYPNK